MDERRSGSRRPNLPKRLNHFDTLGLVYNWRRENTGSALMVEAPNQVLLKRQVVKNSNRLKDFTVTIARQRPTDINSILLKTPTR